MMKKIPDGQLVKLSRMLRAIYPRLKEADEAVLREFIILVRTYQAQFVRPPEGKSYQTLRIRFKGSNKTDAFIREIERKTGNKPINQTRSKGKRTELAYDPRKIVLTKKKG